MANLSLLTLNGALATTLDSSPSFVGIQLSPIKSTSIRLEVGISPILSKKRILRLYPTIASKDTKKLINHTYQQYFNCNISVSKKIFILKLLLLIVFVLDSLILYFFYLYRILILLTSHFVDYQLLIVLKVIQFHDVVICKY